MQKDPEKYHALIYNKTNGKSYFGSILGPFGPKNIEARFLLTKSEIFCK